MEHTAQEMQRHHTVQRAADAVARETQHQQLLAMHQATTAVGTVAGAQQQSHEAETVTALRNEMAHTRHEAEAQQRATAAALAAEQARGISLQWACDRAEERTRDAVDELGATRIAAKVTYATVL